MIKTNVERYFESKSNVPQVSALMAKSVSGYRKDMLEKDVENGFFSEGNSITKPVKQVTGALAGLTKKAQLLTSSNASSNFRGSNDTIMQSPEIYSPLWLTSNLSLPRDKATINAWCRSFYALNPIVHNAINLHSTYPISKLKIKCHDKKIENFFNEMIEEIDLMNICVQIAQEYWLLGEAFVYAELDDDTLKWSRLTIQNPDYIIMERSVAQDRPKIMMRPDEHLKKIVFGNRPKDVEQRKQLDGQIIDAVRRGENIPLDSFNVSHLARRISPYDPRGTGLPVCVFKQLMLFDRFRESKYVQADSMVNPLTLVKIGGEGNDALHPGSVDLEQYRQVFLDAEANKSFKIFTHAGVQVERVGWGSGIYDTSADITQLLKEVYIGLQVPSVLMDGGSDTTYTNGGIALDVLRQRYMQFRNMLGTWLKRKIFTPIAKFHGFYSSEKGERKLIIPDIDWNYMPLFDTNDYISVLKELVSSGDKKNVSLHSLYRSLGLEYEEEIIQKRKEQIQDAILKKEEEVLTTMTLNELRGLTQDSEINEKDEGEKSLSSSDDKGLPGVGMAPDLGGAPDLEPPPELPK